AASSARPRSSSVRSTRWRGRCRRRSSPARTRVTPERSRPSPTRHAPRSSPSRTWRAAWSSNGTSSVSSRSVRAPRLQRKPCRGGHARDPSPGEPRRAARRDRLGEGAPRGASRAGCGQGAAMDGGQHLPLHRLPDDRRGGARRGRPDAERAMKQAHRVVGTSARRADAVAKVTGGARYTVDLSVPGMAYAFVVRSTRAHAAITGIDRTAAAASPGVIRVLIGDDLLAAGLTPYYGHVVLDHPVLAIERVRFQGEPVAVVVAETKREAAEAAELVDVSYEDLPVVIDAQEALKPDAPVLHERRGERVGDEGMDEGEKGLVGNVCAIARVEWG